MDNSLTDREIVEKVILRYARLKPSHGDIRLDPIFDEANDRYVLMQTGWNRGRRVRGALIYITLHDDRVYIEYDGIEHGIIDDLIESGIPEERIVLSYMAEGRESA